MHVSRLPSGRWRAIVQHNGQRASITRPTRSEAQQAAAELLLTLGATPNRTTATVNELIAGHLTETALDWSPTTHADAQRVINRLPDTFLERRVADITPAVIAGLYRQLRREGWSPHRLRRLRMVLSGAWKRAIEYEWAHTNPTVGVPLPRVDQPEVRPPTDDEMRAVLTRCPPQVRLFVRLAAVTGCRRGELLAVQWADIDLDRAELVVRRSLVQVAGSAPQVRPTKTGAKGWRVLTLDLPTVAELRRFRAAQSERALAEGVTPQWVFSHTAGLDPWRPDYISREFARARRRAGVSGVRLHDVRHYVAVTMLQDGESAADVAGQLGHASVATTTSVYWRHMPGRNREATDRRARRLEG